MKIFRFVERCFFCVGTAFTRWALTTKERQRSARAAKEFVEAIRAAEAVGDTEQVEDSLRKLALSLEINREGQGR